MKKALPLKSSKCKKIAPVELFLRKGCYFLMILRILRLTWRKIL